MYTMYLNPQSKKIFTLFATIVIISFLTSCQKEIQKQSSEQQESIARFENNSNGFGTVSPEMVLRWNEAATHVVLQTQAVVPNPPIPPFIESRYYAMVNVAMHDALNNIVPKYKTLALQNARDKDADPNAAVAKAAHDVIAFFFGKSFCEVYTDYGDRLPVNIGRLSRT